MRSDQRFHLKLCAALLCLAPLLHPAPVQAGASDGYLINSEGNPVRSGFGECWHTGSWQPGSRFADCEPAPAPAPVVDAPAPKVVEAPAPVVEQTPPAPAPVPQNIPFRVSMDAFFDFDQATLRPEGEAALDELARRLAVTQYDNLTIVGHADRIGPAAYNQKLSERRANAMRDYLVAQGIEAEKSQPSASARARRSRAAPACAASV